MSAGANQRTGGQVLVDQLRIHGVDTAFCVPGESYLATLDALHDARDDIRMITCRQEGGVTNMAESYGKMTGKPGVAFVTRGPGACNGSIGVPCLFSARHVPLVCRRRRKYSGPRTSTMSYCES